jgi:hypothetical protein
MRPHNEPAGWTADGKTVLFFSTRNGANTLFKQPLSEPTAEPLITVKKDDSLEGGVCVTSEGSSVLYAVRPKGGNPLAPATIMRAPISGGSPQLVLTANSYGKGPRCGKSPAALCVIGTALTARNSFSRPGTGKAGGQLATLEPGDGGLSMGPLS